MGTMYGYARVSTAEQNPERQLRALEAFGVAPKLIYIDHASGKSFERPEWRQLLDVLEDGDTLAVKSIDRLGRGYNEILDMWRYLTRERGVALVVLDMPLLDTRERAGGVTADLVADIVLQLLSYVAQVERENIRQRQAEGIAAARARGKHLGRPRKQRPGDYTDIRSRYLKGELARRQAAACLGVCVSTFDRWLKEDRHR